jgi:hypothetical protein
MPPHHAEVAKLFKVLVLGGLSMAVPACSGGAGPGDDAGGGGDASLEAAQDQSAPPAEAAADSGDGGMCVQIHCPDCGSGVCGW